MQVSSISIVPGLAGRRHVGRARRLPARAALLDDKGGVVAVNKRWRRFGSDNGATSDYAGFNYLEVCALVARQATSRLRAWNATCAASSPPCSSRADNATRPAQSSGRRARSICSCRGL